MKMMFRRTLAWLCFLPGSLGLLAGCQNGMKSYTPPPPDSGYLSMPELAGQLGLKVSRANGSLARLGNANNNVTVFGSPGAVYVNGRVVASGAAVVQGDEMLFVRKDILPTIRASLRAGPLSPTLVRRNPPVRRGKILGVVLLDAGHGGQDPGAIGRGLREKDVVLAVTHQTAERLRAEGVRVELTRSGDQFIPLDGRVAIANRLRPNLFVSIHADASRNRSIQGGTVYIPRRQAAASNSRRAGNCISRGLDSASSNGRGVRTHEKNLRVLESTTCPAVLVELGFLTNSYEVALLGDPSYQNRLAEGLCQAIVAYLRGK
jgi:N-acetylmuramoyl-L-alanine amidase